MFTSVAILELVTSICHVLISRNSLSLRWCT